MNAKEAHEYMNQKEYHENINGVNALKYPWEEAYGYLEALQGEEVKYLIQTLEWYRDKDDGIHTHYGRNIVIPKARQALEIWKAMTTE